MVVFSTIAYIELYEESKTISSYQRCIIPTAARELIDAIFASPLHQTLSVNISFICACLLCLCYHFEEKIREKADVRGVEAR